MTRPIYEKTFTRNFTLVTMQIWSRAETIDKKIWTKEKQPFLPYIVVEGSEGLVSCYYDFRGVAWLKDLLICRSNEDSTFISYLQSEIERHFGLVRNIFTKSSVLAIDGLQAFLKNLELAWIWFEAGWWIWQMAPEEKQKIRIPISKEFYDLRESSHDFVTRSEELIRASLLKTFWELGSLRDFLTFEEIQTRVIPDQSTLKDRKQGFFFVDNKLYAGVSKKYIEDKYKITLESITVFPGLKELKGEIAYKGKIKGVVKIVSKKEEMGKIQDGDILVSSMTLPDLLSAMKKAGAFVTDEGGLLSHAAIIARELKKPCIIGTKIATKVLKDGMMVEVDAVKGIVRIVKQ